MIKHVDEELIKLCSVHLVAGWVRRTVCMDKKIVNIHDRSVSCLSWAFVLDQSECVGRGERDDILKAIH